MNFKDYYKWSLYGGTDFIALFTIIILTLFLVAVIVFGSMSVAQEIGWTLSLQEMRLLLITFLISLSVLVGWLWVLVSSCINVYNTYKRYKSINKI